MKIHACRHDDYVILRGHSAHNHWCRTCGALSERGTGVWQKPAERGDYVFRVQLPKLPETELAIVSVAIRSEDIATAFAWLERLQRHRMAIVLPDALTFGLETDS